MKLTVSLLALLLMLVHPVSAAPPDEKDIAVSMANLKTIHGALVAYEKKHHQWPDHLSSLIPDFLPNEAALRDPSDAGKGNIGSTEAHEDPKFRVSYSYERAADVSNGLPGPLGPFPAPDVGKSWGTWRHVNGHQEYFWGDQVPLVRCFLHRPPEEERADGNDLVLNLTPSGRIYRSKFDWDAEADSIDMVLRAFARDLTLGFGNVRRHWNLGRLKEYLDGNSKALGDKRFKAVLTELAGAMMERRGELEKDARPACQLAALFELKLGNTDRCLAALDEAAKFPGPEWAPVVDEQRRAEAYRAVKNFKEEVATYRRLLVMRPENRAYLAGLANALEAAGEKLAAKEARAKVDPGAALIGKPAPDFTVTAVDGRVISLKEALAGKKALLVNFWFLGCGPCRLEMPHLDALYAKHRDTLGVIGINFGDKSMDIHRYTKDKNFGLTFALGKDDTGRAAPVFSAYHVSSYPTNFVIGADGKILWRGVGFGAADLRELESVLANAGVK
ncbi:MAG TPA: redoxin domain-containing protein [Verrucomicrobiales bacterium]|nr:redoxin domain-containing protein [Verrucomicrobiales bacterium]